MNEEALFASVGGHKAPGTYYTSAGVPGADPHEVEVWDFGWRPPQTLAGVAGAGYAAATSDMATFNVSGTTRDTDRVILTEFWKHPKVSAALGYDFPGVHQITGSCVGAGGGNCAATLGFVEVVRLNDPEQIIIPFWLLPYGRSRFYLGDRNPGEGSSGGTFAKAAREDGFLDAKLPGLPGFQQDDGLVWGKGTELSWSDGDAAQTTNRLSESRRHLVRTVAKMDNADAVREAIVNYYPCTCASMWGMRNMSDAQVRGTPPVLMGRRTGSWSHQMSVQGWWRHPELGEIFLIQNQWGSCYAQDPATGNRSGLWITKSDMDWITRDEVFAFSQFDGYPAAAELLDWVH